MNKTIEDLNFEEAKQHIGGVVFVAIIMVIGFVGNIHVLLVYSLFMKPSNHRLFILVLGILDFITCVVGMPFILVDLRHPLTFTWTAACKVLRFINYFICSSSALMLILIATDRYRKICVPLGRQISQFLAKVLCLVVLTIAVVMSWPAPVLYGTASVPTTNSNVNGSRCYTENKRNYDKLQGYFNAGLILIVLLTFIVLVVLYTMIWRVISRHGNFQQEGNKDLGREASSNIPTTETHEMTSASQSSTDDKSPKISPDDHSDTRLISTDEYSKLSGKKSSVGKTDLKAYGDKSAQKFNRARRTTLMFLLITVVFFLSYVPHLCLKIVAFLKKDFVKNLPFAQLVAYNTFVWCFFMNNAANCFVYGFVDLRFRNEVLIMYQKLRVRARSLIVRVQRF